MPADRYSSSPVAGDLHLRTRKSTEMELRACIVSVAELHDDVARIATKYAIDLNDETADITA